MFQVISYYLLNKILEVIVDGTIVVVTVPSSQVCRKVKASFSQVIKGTEFLNSTAELVTVTPFCTQLGAKFDKIDFYAEVQYHFSHVHFTPRSFPPTSKLSNASQIKDYCHKKSILAVKKAS